MGFPPSPTAAWSHLQIAVSISKEAAEKEDMERLRNELVLAEEEERRRADERAELERRIKARLAMAEAAEQQRRDKAARRQRELEEEEKIRKVRKSTPLFTHPPIHPLTCPGDNSVYLLGAYRIQNSGIAFTSGMHPRAPHAWSFRCCRVLLQCALPFRNALPRMVSVFVPNLFGFSVRRKC